jgi:leader peptidase (prepilin peptidase)/N-methyltransferase
MTFGWHLPGVAVALMTLGWLSVLDWRHHILPRRIIYLTAALGLPWLVIASMLTGHHHSLITMVAGAGCGLIGLGAARIITRGKFGSGDVRLGILLGAYLGWIGLIYAPLGLLAGLSLAAFAGLALLPLGVTRMTTAIPLGPFLVAGAILTWSSASFLKFYSSTI